MPAYSRVPKTLVKNYDFLPDGYSDIFILCETLDEVYADKIVSLVNTEKYIRHRDIWDLRWIKQQGASLNLEFVNHKIADYSIQNFNEKVEKMLVMLPSIILGDDFKAQMSRFIPLDVQQKTLKNEKFYGVLSDELTGLLNHVKNEL